MPNKLSELTVWITGASRGIGLAIAKKFSQEGSKLILSASRAESFKPAIDDFAGNRNVFFMPFDARNSSEIEKKYKKIKNSAGVPDILINNAGIGYFKPMHEISESEYDEMADINLKAYFLTSKLAIKDMMERKSGAIINIQSISAFTSYPNGSVYGATKAGGRAMSRSFRNEVRESGVKVVDMLPGATETGIWNDRARKEFAHRMMQPEDVAEAALKVAELCLLERMMVEEIILRPQTGDI